MIRIKKITGLLSLLLSINIAAQDITYVAHRGASYLAPENTLASIRLAWELGAQAAECDIMLAGVSAITTDRPKWLKLNT